jgi:hypothetical protein
MAILDANDIQTIVEKLMAERAALTEVIRNIDQALVVLKRLGRSPAPTQQARRWRPGGPGRPPKAEAEKRAPVEAVAPKPPKRKSREGKRKRKPPTEKQLAAMAKARAALAEKRRKAAG